MPSSGSKGDLTILLDLGGTRCLVSPKVVKKLGPCLRELKVPVAFCKLDGTVEGGAPTTFVTEPVVMRMGTHRDFTFYHDCGDEETIHPRHGMASKVEPLCELGEVDSKVQVVGQWRTPQLTPPHLLH